MGNFLPRFIAVRCELPEKRASDRVTDEVMSLAACFSCRMNCGTESNE